MRRTRRWLLPFTLIIAAAAPAGAQTMAGGAGIPSAQAGFGRSVAVTEHEVLVGEPQNRMRSGIVYVYRRSATGWAEHAKLTASDAEGGDGFGSALAVDGTTMIVGATRQDERRGAAYVFVRDESSGEWRQTARLTAADLASGDGFGAAVALAGDRALVAAPGQAEQAGAVYVFRRDGDGWVQEAKLVSADSAQQAGFGAAVALAGDRAFIGVPGRENRTGAVMIYHRDADTGEWQEEDWLLADGLEPNARFGSSITLLDDAVLVGAPYASRGAGVIYTFRRGDTGEWSQAGWLVAFDGAQPGAFGTAVAANDNELWIGAPRAADGRGAVYRITGEAGAWNAVRRIGAGDDAVARAMFGGAVGARGDVAAVALLGDDHGAGSVVVFERDPDTGEWRRNTVLKSPPEYYASITGGEVKCGEDGAAAQFECSNVDMVSFLSVPDLGGERGVRVNDVWGWTDPETGREYALVGRIDGTSFVDVTDPENPRYLGNLPKTEGAPASVWRDIKVYKNHAYIVADGAGDHGMQVFDLTRLRDVEDAPVTFEETAHYDRINSAHNVVINEETGFAYVVGASSGGETCGGGLHMVDIRDPKNPTFAGCFADPQTGRANTGYSHDAQCIVYRGPDERYQGREICFGANETALSIADVTDKDNPVAVARASYPNVAYSHQGWITDDHRYFIMNDELDELAGHVEKTRTLIWDITDLEDPQLVREFAGTTEATDHNLYIRDDLMYQSHYQAGLRIVDISDPANPVEVGYFDTMPYGTNTAGFGGSWSNYPFFKSGIIIVTSGYEGLFILKKAPPIS